MKKNILLAENREVIKDISGLVLNMTNFEEEKEEYLREQVAQTVFIATKGVKVINHDLGVTEIYYMNELDKEAQQDIKSKNFSGVAITVGCVDRDIIRICTLNECVLAHYEEE